MGNYFNDGKTARFIEVYPSLKQNSLEFNIEGQIQNWYFDDLQLIDKGHRKIANKAIEDARLSLDEDIFACLIDKAPQLRGGLLSKSHLKLIGFLVAFSIGVILLTTYGIRVISYPLAKYTPREFEEQLSENIKAQIDVALDFCPTNNAGQIALQNAVDRISKNSNSNFKIVVSGIKTPMINAFAMPAGKIYVTNSLIDNIDDGDQLAAVLAHEIAHVENRDVLVSLYQAMGAGLVFDAIVGGGSGAGQQLVLLGANLSNLKNSRSLESRADRRGLELLSQANIDGRGMARFFDKLNGLEGKSSILKIEDKTKAEKIDEIGEFLSSHPNSEKRAIIAQEMAKAGNPAFTPQELQAIKSYCK